MKTASKSDSSFGNKWQHWFVAQTNKLPLTPNVYTVSVVPYRGEKCKKSIEMCEAIYQRINRFHKRWGR